MNQYLQIIVSLCIPKPKFKTWTKQDSHFFIDFIEFLMIIFRKSGVRSQGSNSKCFDPRLLELQWYLYQQMHVRKHGLVSGNV